MKLLNNKFSNVFIAAALLLSGCNSKPTISASTNTDGPNGSGFEVVALKSNLSSAKIINGVPLQQSEAPQVVLLILTFLDGSQGLCTGTAIGPQEILTAGHCVAPGLQAATIVSVNGPIAATAVALMPGYFEDATVQAIFNDTAVLYTPPHGLPMLPIVASAPVLPGDALVAFGYGLDENGESGTLKAGAFPVDIVTPNHIFELAFDGTAQRMNPCNGDSGGPVVGTVTYPDGTTIWGEVGLVSSGTTPNCLIGDVTLATNLQNTDILSFIAAAVPQAMFR